MDGFTLTINNNLRTIALPPGFNLGVYNDNNVTVVKFKAPKEYNSLDLSTFKIRINYENAKGESGQYDVTDLAVIDEKLDFSWLVSKEVCASAGNVKFVVCFIKNDSDGNKVNEFNTTVTTGTVLPGYEPIKKFTNIIVPGTTPTVKINIDKTILEGTTSARVDISQNNEVLIQIKDPTIGESSVTFTLTQEQTYLLEKGAVKVQVHGKNSDGNKWKTKPLSIAVGESLSDTVLS